MKRNWFYYFEGERAVGPLEQSDVVERILAKRLGPYQLMIRDGEEEWRPALAFEEFRQYLINIPTTREPGQSWVVLKRQDAGGHLAVESLGPFTSDEVREQIQAGKVEYTDYVWKDGMSQWRRISSLREFSPFEKPVPIPKPLVDMPPPQNTKQVTREEVMKKVDVVSRTPVPPPPEPPLPKEATGPDLTKPQLPPDPPPVAKPSKLEPTIRPSSVMRGSPAGVERRRLPRTAHVHVKEKRAQPDPELDKTILIEDPKLTPEAKPPPPKEAKAPPLPPPMPSSSASSKEVKKTGKAERVDRVPPKEKEPGKKKEKEKEKEKESKVVDTERTKPGVPEPDEDKEAITRASQIYNARITLPRNWKQILVVLILLGALYVKLFGGPDTIPLSQIPQLPTGEIVPAPPPPPQEQMQQRPQQMQQTQDQPDTSQNDYNYNDQPAELLDPNAPGDEAIRRPLPSDSRRAAPTPPPASKKKAKEVVKEKEATKLHAHMVVQNDGGASLQVDTDAGPSSAVLIEISGAAGQVAERSHYYKRAKWQPGKPISLGGELPAGYYRLKASVGNLTSEEKFEIGTHTKGFFDKLKAARKQSAYEFWNERKRLFQSSQQLGKLVGSKHPGELDRLARFTPTSFAFSDLWAELKEICQLAKKMDPSAPKRLATLQSRITALSVWK